MAQPLLASFTGWVGPVDLVPLVRLALAAVLGGAVGWERERHGRDAGLRTHLLLCLGCALIMVISLHLPTLFASSTGQEALRVDPGRMAAQALSGLGFLGGGAIIVLGNRVRGLTTAASIWVTAAIGMAVGAGYMLPALLTWVMVIIALVAMRMLETKTTKKDRYIQLRVSLQGAARRMETIEQVLTGHGMKVLSYTVDRDDGLQVYALMLRYRVSPNFEETTAQLADALTDGGLRRIQWQ